MSFIYEVVVHLKDAGRIVRFLGHWVDEPGKHAIEDLHTGEVSRRTLVSALEMCFLLFGATRHWRRSIYGRLNQCVHITNATNIRRALEEARIPGTTAYIDNAALSSITLTTMTKLGKLSVGELARCVTEGLKKQRA